MSDFRTSYYDHYASKFKGMESPMSDEALASYFTWCRYKILPLLDGFGLESAILELGCGPGYLLDFLKRCGFTQGKGIDISCEQVELAIERGCKVEISDVFKYLDGKNEAFDGIIALDFIEHFHKEELKALVGLIFKSLKNGGILILQTPNGEGLFPRQVIYGDLTHLTIFTPSSLQQLLKEVGFNYFSFYETGPVPKNILGRVRLLMWIFIKSISNTVRRIEAGKSQTIWTENMICRCEKSIH